MLKAFKKYICLKTSNICSTPQMTVPFRKNFFPPNEKIFQSSLVNVNFLSAAFKKY